MARPVPAVPPLARGLAAPLAALRRTGADLPFGDPRAHHGVAMEGYFWRLTHAAAGRVVVALLGISCDRDGAAWGTVALAAHPGGFVRWATTARAGGDPRRLAVWAGDGGPVVLAADEARLRVDLGEDARLDVRLADRVAWPVGRAFGGSGPAHAVPGLSQYWHPHLLGARVAGTAALGAEEVALDGATAYAEKNWGAGGFPPGWWWGQAQGFDREDVCVAFAGGRAGLGPLQVPAGALVVRAGDELVRLVRPPEALRADVDGRTWGLRGRGLHGVRVEVEGDPAGRAPHRLPVPLPAERRVVPGGSAMHLAGRLRLAVRRRGRTLFHGTTELAGLEWGTPVQIAERAAAASAAPARAAAGVSG
jgi:hypothetical protein